MQSDLYRCLAIGGLLSIIIPGRWTIVVDGWLAPLFGSCSVAGPRSLAQRSWPSPVI